MCQRFSIFSAVLATANNAAFFQKPSDEIAAQIAFLAVAVDFDLRSCDDLHSDTTTGC
jgi:hypothetical protein